jgi:hypothetical protein
MKISSLPKEPVKVQSAATGPSTSNGSSQPNFSFSELKPLSALSTVNSVHRQFVFSKPELADSGLAKNCASSDPASVSQPVAAVRQAAENSCSFGTSLNNGHSQLRTSSSSFNSIASFNCKSGSAFTAKTNGGGETHTTPLLNFKSSAMPDVTNSAKLSKGVGVVQGKMSFNKLCF